MKYKSLYDSIELTKKYQVYEGNLGDVLTDMIKILSKKNKTKQDYSNLAFQSPRIVRALVDYKNNNPNDKTLLRLLKDGIEISLKIYEQYEDPKIKDELLKLKKEIIKLGHANLLKTRIHQYHDFINLIASKPELSQKAAEKLNKIVGEEKAIMLVIGHGAINTGMDVFWRYKDLSGKNNLLFHVVRFSRTEFKKYEDKVPQLTPDEIKYLKKKALGREIIVYDENSYTGKTIKKVVKYLSENVFNRHKINVLYNIDTKNLKI
jgi:hypothetical protein